MKIPSLIFCAPGFFSPLQEACPGTSILSFSTSVEHCQAQLSDLENPGDKQVWLLYQAREKREQNERVIDHINLSTENTLIGPSVISNGPRFPDMSSVYIHDGKGVIVVLGDDPDLKNFNEPWASVSSGVWEAIALKHRGYDIHAWLISDIKKWLKEIVLVE